MAIYRNRQDAGQKLAQSLEPFIGRQDLVVMALPRGCVPVACEVSAALNAPMDIFVVRKLGVPGREEVAMGAIASGGVMVVNDEVVIHVSHAQEALEAARERESTELQRRESTYRQGRTGRDLTGKTVIVVDDGLATGATMRAAVRALKLRHVNRVVVAVPVGAPEALAALLAEADEVVCPLAPEEFRAVGEFYADFAQTTDADVMALLERTQNTDGTAPTEQVR